MTIRQAGDQFPLLTGTARHHAARRGTEFDHAFLALRLIAGVTIVVSPLPAIMKDETLLGLAPRRFMMIHPGPQCLTTCRSTRAMLPNSPLLHIGDDAP